MKEIAISLLKAAATIFPPLLSFLEHATANAPAEHRSLADEVRAELPLRSKTREAINDLDDPEL